MTSAGTPLSRTTRLEPRIRFGAALAGSFITLIVAVFLYKYLHGFDEMMYPACSPATQVALVGIGVAATIVAGAALLLGRTLITRHQHEPITREGFAWTGTAALAIGVACYTAYVVTATQGGVLVPASCHI